MAITLDEIANIAIPVPSEVLDECQCTGRLEAIKDRRKALKLLIMKWYEQETEAVYTTQISQTTSSGG